ncbi:hypothetical protein [Paenibacillus cymbidii]|uniref:hypothetical protein n=1 Tax=Paenibacillus cymbidii TaxID=1639034 RepID=UPI001080DF31|nr:hypothetical protein [Paenibacillus cymbidii]
MGWSVAGVVAGVTLLGLIDVPYLRKMRSRKETWVYIVLMLSALTLNVLWILDVPLPNPVEYITAIYKPLSNWLYGLLK